MKKLILIICISFIANNFAIAQDWPVVLDDNNYVTIRDIIEDYDEGYLISGMEAPINNGATMGFVIKTDINGQTLWKKTFGGINHYASIQNIKKTSDNGYLLAGWTNKPNPNWYHPVFIKLNPCGEIEWCTILNEEHPNPESQNDYGEDAIELPDGSFIGLLRYYGGQSYTLRISMVKLDSFGGVKWIKHLGQNEYPDLHNEEAFEMMLTSDTNILVSGNMGDPLLIQTDTSGIENWVTLWNPDGGGHGTIFKTVEDSHGNYYSSGRLAFEGHKTGPGFIKTDKNGNELYYSLVYDDTIRKGGGGKLAFLNDTTIAMSGSWADSSYPANYYDELYLLDTLGNLINRRALNLEEAPMTWTEITSDNKILFGYIHSPYGGHIFGYLWKFNSDLEDDSLYTQPMTYDSLCPYNITTDTIGLECGTHVNISEIPTKEEYERPIKIYPNPSYDEINIEYKLPKGNRDTELCIYNLDGVMVDMIILPAEQDIIEYNISRFKNGFYIYKANIGNKTIEGKIVVRR